MRLFRKSFALVPVVLLMSVPFNAFSQGIPEVRADVIVSGSIAVQLGAGVLFPLGNYVRSGVVVGAGVAEQRASLRTDLVSTFHLDPFRESRWGPYLGGGISLRRDDGTGRSGEYLLFYLGADGPAQRGYAPALEIGLGGGFRAGVLIRRARAKSR